MIPYGHQTIDQDDIKAVLEVLKSDWLTQGPKVLEFEKKLTKYCGAKYAVAVANGTSALHLAYLAGSIKKGDEVITTPNTFVATTNMLLVVGARPVFCDIRLDTYNIDEKKIEGLITKNTKAIVPVHVAGHSCEMKEILRIAEKYNLLVIEDACHALGAEYNGKKIGSLFSDMTVFSFHPIKPITTGEGGAVVTNNNIYYERLKLLRNHGITKNEEGVNIMTELGFNYRLTDLQSALGLSQLAKINKFIQRRGKIVALYSELLSDIKGIITPSESENVKSSWHLYIIRVKKEEDRDKLVDYLKQNGVTALSHYPCIYNHPYYKRIGYNDLKLSNEDLYSKTCLTIPCFPLLREKHVQYIAKLIKNYFK